MGCAGRQLAGGRCRPRARTHVVGDRRRAGARLRCRRADRQRLLRAGRGGPADRQRVRRRGRAGARRADLLHRRPARREVGRTLGRLVRRSAPGRGRVPRRHPGAGRARHRHRVGAGRERRAGGRDLRLQPARGDRLGRRHAVRRTVAALGGRPVDGRRGVLCARHRRRHRARRRRLQRHAGVRRRVRRGRAADDADRLDGARGQGEGEGLGGPRDRRRLRAGSGVVAARRGSAMAWRAVSSRPRAGPSRRAPRAAAPAGRRRARGRGRRPSARSPRRRTSPRGACGCG